MPALQDLTLLDSHCPCMRRSISKLRTVIPMSSHKVQAGHRPISTPAVKAKCRQVVPLKWQQIIPAVFSTLIVAAIHAPDSQALSRSAGYDEDTANNIPAQLSGGGPAEPGLGKLLNGPKGKEIQACARKCMPGCIRGGEGAPGLGPLTMRKDIVVFREGFRSRQYCLSECTIVCSKSLNR